MCVLQVLGLIYPSPSSELTLVAFSHSPLSPLFPAGSTAPTGDVAPGSLPGRALPSLPFPGPPVPPTPPPAALVVASLSFHTWRSVRISPSSPCAQSQQVAACTDRLRVLAVQPATWLHHDHTGSAQWVHGWTRGSAPPPLPSQVAPESLPSGQVKGLALRAADSWNETCRQKSHLLLRNIGQFLSEFLSLIFF